MNIKVERYKVMEPSPPNHLKAFSWSILDAIGDRGFDFEYGKKITFKERHRRHPFRR